MRDDKSVFGFEYELNIYLAAESFDDLIRWFEEVYPIRLSRDLFQRTPCEDVPPIGVPITREFYAHLLQCWKVGGCELRENCGVHGEAFCAIYLFEALALCGRLFGPEFEV